MSNAREPPAIASDEGDSRGGLREWGLSQALRSRGRLLCDST